MRDRGLDLARGLIERNGVVAASGRRLLRRLWFSAKCQRGNARADNFLDAVVHVTALPKPVSASSSSGIVVQAAAWRVIDNVTQAQDSGFRARRAGSPDLRYSVRKKQVNPISCAMRA